jgi:amidase/6-aminohexanoate-cyclic-dimer hydrolase
MSGIPDYDDYDALGLAGLVADKQVTAGELLDEAVRRTEKVNGQINAVTVRLYDEAKAQIAGGLPQGPFTGVPFLLKDLGALLTGTRTTYGSRLFAEFVADHDTELVARYKRAGLVVFGKSSSPEMGVSPSTEPALFGPCRSPWSLEHSAGGSSGGAAAAVAARVLPAAHATDGGGSIRIPASACGLFGLKPTRARTPSGPDIGEGWGGQSIAHAVTLSVRDSAALLDATAGPDTGDPYWAPPPARPYLAEVGSEPGKLRIAVTTVPWNGEPVDAECKLAAEQAAKLCESLGHVVDFATPVFDAEALREATRIIVAANVRNVLETRAAALGRPLKAGDVEPLTMSLAQSADKYNAMQYARSINVLHRTGRIVAHFFGKWDVLLTPTMCNPPWPLGVLSLSNPDGDAFATAVNRSIGFTALFNATGNPAMSVPLHWTLGGLPVGVQFVGRFGDEATLFRLAAQLEAAKPWIARRPPVVAA